MEIGRANIKVDKKWSKSKVDKSKNEVSCKWGPRHILGIKGLGTPTMIRLTNNLTVIMVVVVTIAHSGVWY